MAIAFLAVALAMALFIASPRSLEAGRSVVPGRRLRDRLPGPVRHRRRLHRPTELVLVPMLFLLPTPVVPLVVSVSWALGRLLDYARAAPASTGPSTSSATAGTRSAPRWC